MSDRDFGRPNSPDGWSGEVFVLGALQVERSPRRVTFAGRTIELPRGALFYVLLALCEAWAEDDGDCRPIRLGTRIQVPPNKTHLVHYDDVSRLRQYFGSRDFIECVTSMGYRLRRVDPPSETRRKHSGVRRITGRRRG